jgi:N-acetyl-anhydromuramyl-L-alanine amidase AmpD
VVFHYTENRPALQFIRYQHNGDDNRGGAFGYHFYCDRKGNAYQGAPLSVRTNHIKPTGHRQRKTAWRYWSSSNTVGIGMVGGCWRDPNKRKPITASCDGERLTEPQKRCGMAIARALQDRFHLEHDHVAGHGDLQNDRSDFEGSTLTAVMQAEAKDTTNANRPAGMMALGAQ